MIQTLISIFVLCDESACRTGQNSDGVVKHVMDDAAAGYFEQQRQVKPVWGGVKGDEKPAQRPAPNPQGNAWWLGSGEDDEGLRPKGLPLSPIMDSASGGTRVNFVSISRAYNGSVVDAKRLAEHLYMPDDVFAAWFDAKRGQSDDVEPTADTHRPKSASKEPATPQVGQPADAANDTKRPEPAADEAEAGRSGSTPPPSSTTSAAKERRGRKEQYDWPAFREWARTRKTEGLPETQADFEQEALTWFSETYDREPHVSTLRKRISQYYQ